MARKLLTSSSCNWQKEDIVETHIILPESTGLEKKFGPKAKNGIWVLVSKKNPNYWDEFKKQLAQE